MMLKSRLKAFTILEMLINIAVMSIIIGIVYFVYSSFARQVTNYQSNIEEQMEMESFFLQVKTDFFNAEKIVSTADSFKVYFYNTKYIQYKITDEYLIRKQNESLDSLGIIRVTLNTVTRQDLNTNFIQSVIITVPLFSEPLSYVITKEYLEMFDYSHNNGD